MPEVEDFMMTENESLPIDFKIVSATVLNEVNFECIIRANIHDEESFSAWLKNFSDITKTNWILRSSIPREHSCYVFSRNYFCQHSLFKKSSKKSAGVKINKPCPASLKVRIQRNTKNIQLRYHCVKEGLRAILIIKFQHSHRIKVAEVWGWLKRQDVMRRTFIEYFNNGLSPADAIHSHENALLADGAETLADASINPPKHWVNYLHNIWQKSEYVGAKKYKKFYKNFTTSRKVGLTSYALQKRRSERQRQRLIKKGLLGFRKLARNREFKFEWMKFYEWIVPVKDNKYEAHCTRCNMNVDLRSTGHLALLAHEKSEKHRNNWSRNTGGEYRQDNYASTQSGTIPIESPNNTAGIYFDLSRVKVETIDDDDSSSKTVNPSNPQSSKLGLLQSVLLGSKTSRAADSTSTGGQSVFLAHKDDNVTVSSVSPEPSQTGTTIEKSSSYSYISNSSVPVKQELENVEMTFEIDSSYSSVPSSPTAMEQTSQNAGMIFEVDSNACTTPAAMEDTHRNVEMGLKKGIDYPSTSGFSAASPEPSQIGTTVENSTSYSSIPSSIAMEQELQNVEMTFEVDNSYPSVPSSPTAIEQTPQNAGIIFEIDSNACTTPAATEETHRSAETALKKGTDYPSTSVVSTATIPTEQNTELPLKKSGIYAPSSGTLTGLNKKDLIVLLERYSEPSSRKHEVHFPRSNISSANEAESAQNGPKNLQTHQRAYSIIRYNSKFKNELHSIVERFDEAERVYENKCRIIMEDYRMLLNSLSHESDHTFLPNDIFMPEYGSAWNSLKLAKILLGEEYSSENSFPENKQNTIDSQHGNGSNYNGSFSINQTRVVSGGHVFSCDSPKIRKRGRPRKHDVRQLLV